MTTVAAALAAGACAQAQPATPAQPESKCLVLYYSQTGTTEAVAKALQAELGADIEAIQLEDPYTGTYGETIARVSEERQKGVTPKTKPLTHNPKDYNVVFLGYPIWFGTYAPPIAGMLQTTDLSGMTVVPFCTFGSGGIDESTDHLKSRLPETHISQGYGVRTARIGAMPAELHRFLLQQGYIQGEAESLPDYSMQRPVSAEEAEIFNEATSGYMFPLGTAVTCGHRSVPEGEEYMYVARNTAPDGTESYSTVMVIKPADPGLKPEFTKVTR